MDKISPFTSDTSQKPAEVAARCHEIQTGLGLTEVPEFESIRLIGMCVRVALHIRGLPSVNYETLRLVAGYFLGIPTVALKPILAVLAEVEFIKLNTEGKTIKAVIPNVPYYEQLYDILGQFAENTGFNEAEQLSIEILSRLSKSPEKLETLKSYLGAESKLIVRAFDVGQQGAYFRICRSRGREIALSPTYFSENAEIYADIVAGSGSKQVKKLLTAVRSLQGMPLSVIQQTKEIGGIQISDDEVNLLLRLAQDGAVKPPSIRTSHAGEQFFLFTPTPTNAALAATKRDIYEKAMAIVAAVRQGQFLPKKYVIRSPRLVINALKVKMKLGKATTEATEQYRKLVHLRVARLEDVGHGFSELHIIDTEENREALSMAYDLVSEGTAAGTEVDESAREALQREYAYIESLVASGLLLQRQPVILTPEQDRELDMLFLK